MVRALKGISFYERPHNLFRETVEGWILKHNTKFGGNYGTKSCYNN